MKVRTVLKDELGLDEKVNITMIFRLEEKLSSVSQRGKKVSFPRALFSCSSEKMENLKDSETYQFIRLKQSGVSLRLECKNNDTDWWSEVSTIDERRVFSNDPYFAVIFFDILFGLTV